MPPAFRKNGSFVRFFIDGELPSPDSDEFVVQLAAQRFRSIERAASEEVSVGWVAPGDPSGQDFVREDIVVGNCIRLRMRIDRKKLPPAWMAIYLEAEIRSRNGQGVSAREKRELKADIEDKLLPRILPTVQFVDVLCSIPRRSVLLFSTSRFVGVECAKLFHSTWDVNLIEADPSTIALRSGLPEPQMRYLENLAPFALETNGRRSDSRIPSIPEPAREAEAEEGAMA